jgi:prepilin-type N-terminal cleavage/methylation domain-containing protein
MRKKIQRTEVRGLRTERTAARQNLSTPQSFPDSSVLSPQSSVLRGGGRRAFTLIEVLTVIAIILVLVGLFFGGWKKWGVTEARQLTFTRMESLNGMLAELEAAGHNQYQTQWFASPTAFLDASRFGNIAAIDLNNLGSSYVPPNDMLNVNGTQTTEGVSCYPNALSYMTTGSAPTTTSFVDVYAGSPPAAYTPPYGIMTKLMQLPNAAKELGALPASATVSTAGPATAGLSPTNGVPVVLDGWGNPILFVPAGGMVNVYTNVSSGTPTKVSVTSPDGRPFWVSAGPDGDLLRGDDNLYSFDQH